MIIGFTESGLLGALKVMPFMLFDFLFAPSQYIALDLLNPFSSESPFIGEFAPLFYASMMPSIWLWFYVAATLIVRLAVRAAPVFRFSMYLFDIDQHPIRSVGIVAAALVSGAYAIFLVISKLAQVLSA
jgi:hypothetical protein